MPARSRTHVIAWSGVVLTLALSAGASAQAVVVGEVVEGATAEPLRGVFVALVDGDGRQVGGVLTDGNGRFRARAPRPGTYTLRADRIGFGPVVSPPLELGAAAVTYRFELESRPIELGGVVAAAEGRQCRVRPEEGSRLQAIWEQARMALDIAALTERTGVVGAQQRTYQRWLDPVSGRVREETARGHRTYGRAGFAAAPPEELVAEGFVREAGEGGGYVFHGLDASTILSDAFLDAHCFRLRTPPRGQQGLVGLAFEPVRGAAVPGVRGVLWLDAASAELRTLEYAYTWLPWALPLDPFGGEASFRRLPGGEWIVDQWSIRMPEVDRVPPDFTWSRLPGRDLLARLRTEAGLLIKEEGGEVTALHAVGTAPVPTAEGAVLQGVVHDSVAGRPLAGARVRIEGTAHEATTDGEGRYRMAGLPAGIYAVTFEHPVLDEWGLTLPAREVMLTRGRVTSQDLAVPSTATILAAECPECPDPELPLGLDASSRVVGRVVDAETGRPVRGVTIRMDDAGGARVTGADGAFVFPSVAPGHHGFEARHLAYETVRDTLRVDGTGRALQVEVRIAAGAIPLDPIVVTVDRRPVSGDIRAVYDRIDRVRLWGGGTVFTREDIERRNATEFTRLVDGVRGVNVDLFPQDGIATPLIFSTRAISGWGPCLMTVWIDGVMAIRGGMGNLASEIPQRGPPTNINDLISMSNIEAVEIYHPSGSIPAQYWGSYSGCGVVLIWTRRET